MLVNKINRKVEYALVALKHMRAKSPGELTSVKELTLLYGCPFEITSRVMQGLARKGLLQSTAGAHGGYQIMKDLQRVSFYELNEMVLGPMAVAKCLQHADATGCGMRETCNIVSPVQTLSRKLAEFYRGLTLAELLESRASASANARAASVEERV
jgi:Rrf2 family nitric oxide-sensitive transcriptional repressor